MPAIVKPQITDIVLLCQPLEALRDRTWLYNVAKLVDAYIIKILGAIAAFKHLPVLAVSAHERYGCQSYDYQPFWFISKRKLEKLDDVLLKLAMKLKRRKESEELIYLKFDKLISVNVNELIYFKSDKHYIYGYTYTALDEYSRFRYVEAFEEHNTYTSMIFLEHVLKAFKFPVKCVQTDNGSEFTKRLNAKNPTLTMFEKALKSHRIEHKLIRPYTPRHNGKVERSHRKDNEYLYATHTFYSFEDFVKQLKVHNYKYNKFPMRPLNWKSPADYVKAFLDNGENF